MRLFVAVYPPADAAAAMLGLLAPLPLPPNRPTPVEQLHLTLLFIGDTRPNELRAVKESLGRAASGAGTGWLAPRRIVALPAREPRLIAVEAGASPSLLEVQRRLATRLARGGKSDRLFLPHLTLTRLRSPAERSLAAAVERDIELPVFDVARIELVQSVLSREGASHESIASFPLSD